MKLEEYLKAIKDCPDKFVDGEGWKLHTKYGVYDNWPILLNHDFERFTKFLSSTGNYRCPQTIKEQEGTRKLMEYSPGTAMVQVFDYIPLYYTTGRGHPEMLEIGEERLHCERQIRDYNMAVMLHFHEERIGQIKNFNFERPIARVIGEIGDYLLRENVPSCMNKTRPMNVDWNDCSYIIYHS